ncbi:MAG: putative toxin-antitoxin system toxin component, PIN family [Gemmatimonadales bacterium]
MHRAAPRALRVVLDTNVIVSGLLGPGSVPAQAAAHVFVRRSEWLVDPRIVEEYRRVLSRPHFRFVEADVQDVLLRADLFATWVHADPLPITLPDPTDVAFLEVAIAGGADALVTGNVKDYQIRGGGKLDIAVVTPRQFLDLLARR